MTAHQKSVLVIIAPEQFRDEELFEPKGILERRGAGVTVVSTRKGKAQGMMGGCFDVSRLTGDQHGASHDAVVVVGGMGSPAHLWENQEVHRLLCEADQAGKVVAGICLSGAVLAKAGVLRGKRATVWATHESVQALRDGGAEYVKQDVVEDGRAITAEGPHAAVAFGEAIARALGLGLERKP